MGNIVNLRMARKRLSRRRDEVQAVQNRAAHGVAKPDRQHETKRRDKAAKHLDQHRLDTGEDR